MTAPKHRSRRLRRVFVKSPSGNNKIQYKVRKNSKPTCNSCGKVLAGVPHTTFSRLKKITKSKKTISRPFGGQLCSSCSRKELIARAKWK